MGAAEKAPQYEYDQIKAYYDAAPVWTVQGHRDHRVSRKNVTVSPRGTRDTQHEGRSGGLSSAREAFDDASAPSPDITFPVSPSPCRQGWLSDLSYEDCIALVFIDQVLNYL